MANVDGSSGAENISTAGSGIDPSKDPKRKAKSNDPGWKYGFWPNLEDKNCVKCILCGVDTKGVIKRLKQHLIGGYGDVAKCTKTTAAIATEMREAILKNKKRRMEILDVDGEDLPVEGAEEGHVESDLGGGGGRAQALSQALEQLKKKKKVVIQTIVKQQVRGPMDAHVKRRTPEEIVAERHGKGPQQTTMENRMRSEEERDKLRSYFARWAYESGVPFNALKLRSFEELVEAIGQYGPGLKPPSFHDYRVPLLKSEKEKIDEIKKKHKISWKKGCTLMSDGWTDKKGRHLINFLVNSTEGTFFLGSVDASSQIQDAKMLFEFLDSKIEEIEEENVVQVVTDNASNYVATGRLLMEKRKKLYWTPCAVHCLDLMMEEIDNIKTYRSVILKGRKITSFIYRHTRLLEAMRVHTRGADLVRAGATRFASSFLTLQSLLNDKDSLRKLFLSDHWESSKLSHTEPEKQIVEIVISTPFWNGVQDCLRPSLPLLQVLRIVDGDERLALPEVYIAMEEMERPIYLAAFLLNPSKYFSTIENESDESLANSLMHKANDAYNDILARMVPDTTLQDKISG
ncbi:uncharacterized protein LOC122643867 [Telopea speciosissima]|uniref:uncharacterized protein LOC122643867 n=1 Tax=Telopea speciosissima TaxID=54955 RepID=UPI001CC66FC8|nr:uncharacterized protein LOC122643867 [Telopea speciosissima]